MKYLISIILLSIISNSFAQSGITNGPEINVEVPYAPANIQLLRDSSVTALMDSVDNRKIFSFTRLEPGHYLITLNSSAKDTVLKDFFLKDTSALSITIKNVGPCLYDHPKDYKPKCPMGHYNKIIPITYGMPALQEMKDADKGKVKLAGDVMFLDCNPHFYCTIHKISF